ncbi:8-oxoguanine DNA glycosylase OGG fold protein [Williamsia sterculiae]|uniref:Uncharacterized protein n=1 Tax=Williamsia sterculiae TaxID=1344003 RepID=A0A1N7GFZ1_9NOCA|nr:hypothetical protein [Williamsia sterculiae]SIS11513.1 hypothetical protein SAMN05445060_2741 [Williamsia sterculiae]
MLDQAIKFDPALIAARLPSTDLLPVEFDDLPQQGKYRVIARRDVFRIAEQRHVSDDPLAAAQLHVAACAWGAGTGGQNVARALKPFHDPEAEAKLAKALQVLRGEGPVSAYRALQGRLKISGLNSGYFTKFLYFGGYGSKPQLGEPLIYDSNVVDTLNYLKVGEWVERGPADMYGRYLDLANDWAAELGTSPDVVERRLFGR